MDFNAEYPQIDAMRMGVDYRFPIRVRNFTVLVRPVSMGETVQIYQEVAMYLENLQGVARNSIAEKTSHAKQTLMYASMTDVGTNDPKLTGPIIDRMTPDELIGIFKQYVAGCDRVNPSLERMPPEELAELIAELKKKQLPPDELALVLTELTLSQLASMANYLLTKGD